VCQPSSSMRIASQLQCGGQQQATTIHLFA
jgi:hypothetical protein